MNEPIGKLEKIARIKGISKQVGYKKVDPLIIWQLWEKAKRNGQNIKQIVFEYNQEACKSGKNLCRNQFENIAKKVNNIFKSEL